MQCQGASLVARFTVIEAGGDEGPGLQAITSPGQEPMSCLCGAVDRRWTKDPIV
jgi:hypothetical protein